MNFSLPGLGTADDNPSISSNLSNAQVTPITHSLSAHAEYRFEVAHGSVVRLKLLTGSAEIFGTELVIGSTPYTFSGVKAAIYTWQGCTFEMSGELGSEYTGEETTMDDVFGTHASLEGMRDAAGRMESLGPRTLVLGPENVGKSTLVKILAGYAIRSGRSPVVVNLDSHGEGMLSLPGTISAGVFKSPLDVESVNGWGNSPMSGPSGNVPVKLPLVYHYGLESVAERDGSVYKSLVSRLALAIMGRLQGDAEAREGGVLIDTQGVLAGGKIGNIGYDLVSHIVSEMAVNGIICLGSERLYADMVKRFDGKPTSSTSTGETISVVKLARSGGCVERDDAFMAQLRAAQIKNYFYGAPAETGGVSLSPRQQTVDFATLSVYRCVGARSSSGPDAGMIDNDDSFLPGGGDDDFYAGMESKVPLPASQSLEHLSAPVPGMQNAVLAIMNCAPDAAEREIRDSSVMGFVYVTEVDEARGRLGLLSPVAGRIPSRSLVWGNWPEAVLGMV